MISAVNLGGPYSFGETSASWLKVYWNWKKHFLRVIPDQATFYLTCLLTLNLASFLAFYLTFLLTFHLAFYLTLHLELYFFDISFHLTFHLRWHSIDLATIRTFRLALYLTCYLAFYSGCLFAISEILSAILYGMCSGPCQPSLIWTQGWARVMT